MQWETIQRTVELLYKDIDGFSISQEALAHYPYFYTGFSYDEMSDESFYRILQKACPGSQDVFVDLGSGIGKKVFIAALGFTFSKAKGVEILPEVYKKSEQILAYYQKEFADYSSISPEFLNTDFHDYDYSEGSIFFLSLTRYAMDIELTGRLGGILSQLKKGTKLITTAMPFPSGAYEIIECQPCTFLQSSDGEVFLSQKIE